MVVDTFLKLAFQNYYATALFIYTGLCWDNVEIDQFHLFYSRISSIYQRAYAFLSKAVIAIELLSVSNHS